MSALLSIYIWMVGGLYFLLLCFSVIFLSLFLKPRTYDRWLKFKLRFLFKIIFVKVRIKGREYIESGKNYLFMSNHASMFDVPLFEGFIPTYVRGVEALRQFKWPVYGWATRRLGNIPINRKNIHSSIRSIKVTENLLKKGRSILILPEGSRTLDGKMRPFKRLPFHLAKQAGVPIIPIGLSGLFELKNKGSWMVRPRPITMCFGPAIDPETIKSLSIEELSDLVRHKIQELIEPL